MPTKPISALSLNETLYPRHAISATNIAAITEAIRAGADIPPVTVDAETLKVIDGFHRVHAYQRLHGPEYEIAVVLKTYGSRAEMLADAIAQNVGRGADLTRWDLLRCIEMASEVNLPFDTLASLIKWRPERLRAYQETRVGRTLDDRRLALKRSIQHRLNDPLNAAQEAANAHLSGMPAIFHANQLITLIETDLLPHDDPNLAERLSALAELITGWVSSQLVEVN